MTKEKNIQDTWARWKLGILQQQIAALGGSVGLTWVPSNGVPADVFVVTGSSDTTHNLTNIPYGLNGVYLNGKLLRDGSDYTLNYALGVLNVSASLVASDVIEVHYVTTGGTRPLPEYFDSCSGDTSSGTAFTTSSLSGGCLSGDVLVAAFNISQFGASRDLTVPTGWSAIDSGGAANSDCRMRVIKRICDGTEGSSFTFNFTGSAQTHSGAVIRSRNLTGSVGGFSIANSASTSATAAADNSLALAFFIQNDGTADGNNVNAIATSGWTTDQNDAPVFHAVVAGHKNALVTNGTTVSPTVTWGGTVQSPMSAVVVLNQ